MRSHFGTMRVALAITTGLLLTASASAQITPDVQSLISAYNVADEACRGSPDADAACYRRTDIGVDLNRRGWCYGKQGQGRASFIWHRCSPGSYDNRIKP